ncbi:MAG: putative multidrug export ATP-binding/permease protein [Planctomycetota bacterium]|nr:putative multidrug export ATP-binding/permease protein [Planctomycetota bacterium]
MRDDLPAGQTRPAWSALGRVESEFLRPHRIAMLGALVVMLVQSLLALPIPLLQGWAVDQLLPLFRLGEIRTSADNGRLAGLLAAVLASSVACHAGRMLLGWKAAAIMSRVALEAVRDLTDALHRKLQRQAMRYFDRHQTGQILARLTGDVGSLLLFLNGGSLTLISDLVLSVGIAALMLWLSPKLALACLVVLPLYALFHRQFAAVIQDRSRRARQQASALCSLLSERLSAVRVVRSFAKEDVELAALDRQIDAQREIGWDCLRISAWQGAIATLIGGCGTVLVVVEGVVLVRRGEMTVGEMLAFHAMVVQLYNPIVRLAGFQPTMAATAVAASRIVEVLDEPEVAVTSGPRHRLDRLTGGLSYRGVSFSYGPARGKTLAAIDLEISPGMTLGVLGASASGKSTLLALAPRIYDLGEGDGSILLGGRDIRDFSLADLRRAVALVPQQALLFEGTIRSNLTYAHPEATRKTILDAVQTADLAELIDSLPLGLDTPVGERGHTLSGGQRQRLALARALVAEPAILLLDDCTSALDAETEARIQDALARHRPDRTRVVVSHKVSSVRNADRIVVLCSGQIAESGTHDDLMRQAGLYARTYRRQTESLVYGAIEETVRAGV